METPYTSINANQLRYNMYGTDNRQINIHPFLTRWQLHLNGGVKLHISPTA